MGNEICVQCSDMPVPLDSSGFAPTMYGDKQRSARVELLSDKISQFKEQTISWTPPG